MEHKLFTKKEDIEAWLTSCGIKLYDLVKSSQYGFIVNVPTFVYFQQQAIGTFKVKFGEVKGDFDCGQTELSSLFGAPDSVEGNFYCNNNYLTSLIHLPKKVKNLNCRTNKISSLLGCPDSLDSLDVGDNLLTSLEHAPKNINNNLYCDMNRLETLKGAPKNIFGTFDCSYNKLLDLKYCPEIISSRFYASDNALKSLIYFPKSVIKDISLDYNKDLGELQYLTSFVDAYAVHKSSLEKEMLQKNINKIKNKENKASKI